MTSMNDTFLFRLLQAKQAEAMQQRQMQQQAAQSSLAQLDMDTKRGELKQQEQAATARELAAQAVQLHQQPLQYQTQPMQQASQLGQGQGNLALQALQQAKDKQQADYLDKSNLATSAQEAEMGRTQASIQGQKDIERMREKHDLTDVIRNGAAHGFKMGSPQMAAYIDAVTIPNKTGGNGRLNANMANKEMDDTYLLQKLDHLKSFNLREMLSSGNDLQQKANTIANRSKLLQDVGIPWVNDKATNDKQTRYRDFTDSTAEISNAVRHAVTGAQAGEKELESIISKTLNTDLSPEAYAVERDHLIEFTQRALAAKKVLRSQNLLPGDPGYGEAMDNMLSGMRSQQKSAGDMFVESLPKDMPRDQMLQLIKSKFDEHGNPR